MGERVDPRERFSGAASGYARSRPSYPEPLVDWVLAEAAVGPKDRVVDVGCGTGIFTRLLAARGLQVVGIDANHDMLAQARAAGAAEYRRGEAEATGLDGASVALVTAAQVFHWLDAERALAEFRRILRPGGHAAAIWNLRGEGRLMADYDALLRRFSTEYAVLESWEDCLARLQAHSRVAAPRVFETPNAQLLDFEGLHGRAWSSSYVRHGVQDATGFDAALRSLFEAHARDGVVEFPYRAKALVFRLA